ncbi:1bec0c09-b9d0-44d1-8dbe-2335fc5c03c5 [Thermothielavioides terrestris]|uniref:Extracellular membrane protein CFEM domain-containing protein n=2 Tax=Thermothielavioides terrestris TaxID=2587410 RepID=G2RFC9_THETT|nr:uncharacterized protein THITE_2147249 [Thermothielavioides terrestris NRRL 8126]AEO70412.1 hypothetical protein THITE_2147249 [Thermothielavioides terrestris NRRL 8126]SPQ18235.1 1bec0c09-b9d0-44d1-8dbe-2335fc5c03c5 [Thermothielavioides terrestris]
MRLTTILFAGTLALFANAQTTTNTPATATTDAATAAQTSAEAAMIACIDKCKPGDVACTSKCIAVPNPNAAQVNATTTCVAECPKGNGTASDTAAYASCVERCIGANYYTASGGTPEPTGSSGSSGSGSGSSSGSNGGGSSASGSSGSGTSGNQPSSTSSGAAASSSTGAAAVGMQLSGGVLGAVGFLAAVMAL